MTEEQIKQLLLPGGLPAPCAAPELLETHISWVLLCDEKVYKIKKPVHYSFLDFSSIELREFYCHREIELNKRLTTGMYLDVMPVMQKEGGFTLGSGSGAVVDYAVCMRKVDRDLQMDMLLKKNKVSFSSLDRLAARLADFHKKAAVIHSMDFMDVRTKFNAIAEERDFIGKELGKADLVQTAIDWSNAFLDDNGKLLARRSKDGWFRDVHGDLHTGNIFLLPEPIIFDCIEFSDAYRQIDLLNELAFLCMDIEALGHPSLADHFLAAYNAILPVLSSQEERRLFHYYKAYRANVLATVNSIKARTGHDEAMRKEGSDSARRYLELLERYMNAGWPH